MIEVSGNAPRREERLAEERSGRAADRLELRELRSKEAGYVRELKERSDEVEELNQVWFYSGIWCNTRDRGFPNEQWCHVSRFFSSFLMPCSDMSLLP